MHAHDRVCLHHMLEAAEEALLIGDHRSRICLLAVMKDIEIIGEAAFQTSENTRGQLPEIPWEDIVGMRHRLVHAYFDINLDILWKTVHGDMAPLIFRLEQVLERKRN